MEDGGYSLLHGRGVGGWHSMSFGRSLIRGVVSRVAGLILVYPDKGIFY